MQSSTKQQEIEALLSLRPRTDYHISGKWLLAAVGNYLIWATLPWIILLGFVGGVPLAIIGPVLVILGTVGLIASASSAYLVYLLVNRRNTHFAREQAVFGSALDILRTKVRPDDMNAQASLVNNYRYYQWLGETSGEKSAILQSLLTLVPYLGWLFLTFELLPLCDDWKEHEVREDYMIQDVNRTLGLIGSHFLPARLRPSPVRFRSGVLYLILSIVT